MKTLAILIIFFLISSLDAGTYLAKDYSHLLGHLKGLSDPLLKMHFTLYQGYVKNSNAIEETLKEMEKEGRDQTIAYGALKRRFGFEYDGMVLHELYFENLGGENLLLKKDQPLYQLIERDFGSFERWRKDFLATGMIRGIGWVILYQDFRGILHNVWVDEHQINHLAGARPLLVMDVWEHAYITEYGLDRKGYLEAFYSNINWDRVASRLK
ncbi:MAG: superoxide dismutase [Chlamydiales bacterium]|nr:superoxide dismutase [Chlamydiales bacterium]